MASRTTEWRWRTRGQPQLLESGRKRGRRLRNERIRGKTLVRAAELIEEARSHAVGGVDYALVHKEEVSRAQRPDVKEIFFTIRAWEMPADLIAVATCDALHIGTRTVRRSGMIWTPQVIAEKLREKIPQITKDEAMNYAKEYPDWLDHVLASDKPAKSVTDRRCCISKVFRHIKKQMSCHWRKHPYYRYAVKEIQRLKEP